jgi:3-hydroxybutyrate dehydrogenase
MTQGLNAVITGSTSGIGQGIAEAFAKAGMNVMLNGFGDPDEIETLRARLGNALNAACTLSWG